MLTQDKGKWRRFYIASDSPFYVQHQVRRTSVLGTLPGLLVESFPQMDLLFVVIAEAAVERERQNIRRMELSLRADIAAFQEKEREREMLKTSKEEMLADEAAKEKLVDEFMAFTEAIENNDPEIAHNFDEKAMMNAILTMMKINGCDNGGIVGGAVKKSMKRTTVYKHNPPCCGDNVPEIKLDVEEKPTMEAALALNNRDVTLALNNSVVNSGGKFVGGNGKINNAPENAHNLGEGGMMPAIQGTNGDGGEGAAAGIGDSFNGNSVN